MFQYVRIHEQRKERSMKLVYYNTAKGNAITGYRYWVHFSGCKVTEIIEERGEEYESERD